MLSQVKIKVEAQDVFALQKLSFYLPKHRVREIISSLFN